MSLIFLGLGALVIMSALIGRQIYSYRKKKLQQEQSLLGGGAGTGPGGGGQLGGQQQGDRGDMSGIPPEFQNPHHQSMMPSTMPAHSSFARDAQNETFLSQNDGIGNDGYHFVPAGGQGRVLK